MHEIDLNQAKSEPYNQSTHVIDRSFNDTLAKCLFSFSSISQEKYTVQQETIISVSSISITVHFCTYSYESLLAESIF